MIVDDERLAIDRMEALCCGLRDVTVVGTAADGEEALVRIAELKPDLLLLDVSMPELGGIEVARALEAAEAAPAVVFCTAFANFAVAAFDVAAVDYLLKPVTVEALERAFERTRLRRSAQPTPSLCATDAFWVPHRGELRRIAAVDIERIEADRDYMRLHVHGRSYLLNQTITRLEERLDPRYFIRIHRSHIVRRDLITTLVHEGGGVWSAKLVNGVQIRVGRSYLPQAKSMAE